MSVLRERQEKAVCLDVKCYNKSLNSFFIRGLGLFLSVISFFNSNKSFGIFLAKEEQREPSKMTYTVSFGCNRFDCICFFLNLERTAQSLIDPCFDFIGAAAVIREETAHVLEGVACLGSWHVWGPACCLQQQAESQRVKACTFTILFNYRFEIFLMHESFLRKSTDMSLGWVWSSAKTM
jgi:hypothetical protein